MGEPWDDNNVKNIFDDDVENSEGDNSWTQIASYSGVVNNEGFADDIGEPHTGIADSLTSITQPRSPSNFSNSSVVENEAASPLLPQDPAFENISTVEEAVLENPYSSGGELWLPRLLPSMREDPAYSGVPLSSASVTQTSKKSS